MGRERGVYKRGQVWWIDYTDLKGRRHRELVGPSYRTAVGARRQRLEDVAAGKFGLRRSGKVLTFRAFVDDTWRSQVAPGLKPTTRRAYEMLLRVHLLPAFGDWPLGAITRPDVKAFIAKKAQQQRHSYAKDPKKVNPHRATLAPKTLRNMVGLLASVLEAATIDYELLAANPLRGVLSRKRRFFPTEALRPRQKRPRILEPEDFKRAVGHLPPKVVRMALTAALAGLRWGELVALRIESEIDFRANKIHVTRQLYKRVPQTPKTDRSERDIDMSPIVRRIMKFVPRDEGLVFSPDGREAIGEGSWVKRQWRKAQLAAHVRHPIRWHDLRHQYVSLLIAAGKSAKYIAEQAGHASVGFTLDTYGHLFETIKPVPVEWPEDLLWPAGLEGHVAALVDGALEASASR